MMKPKSSQGCLLCHFFQRTHLQDTFAKPNECSLERIKEPQAQKLFTTTKKKDNWQAVVYLRTSIC